MNNIERAYEVPNPSFSDMSLGDQIEAGVNDWCATGKTGHPYYGATQEGAEEIRSLYEQEQPC